MKSLSRFASLAAVTLIASLALGTAAHAAVQGPNKCLAGKNKCASKKMQGLLKCHYTAEKKGLPLDPACTTKAEDKFDGDGEPAKGCFVKLETKNEGPCLTTGDTPDIETKVDNFVDDVVSELDPGFPAVVINACSAGKKKCVLKKAAALMKCHEKAVKDGAPVDLACTQKAYDKFDGGTKGFAKSCFGKLEFKYNVCALGANDGEHCDVDTECPGGTCFHGCLSSGDLAALESKVDAFVQDVLCELGYTTLTQPCNPTTPTPTVTPSPTVTPCPTTTAGASCPTIVQADADGPTVDLDTGWTGLSHDAHVPTNGRLTLTVSGCAGGLTPPCGQCTLSGPLPNAGGPQFSNHRCVGDVSISCNGDLDCGGDGPCAFYFGAPLPLSAGGTAVCITNQITGPVTGTVNIESGDTETSIPLLSKVHFVGATDAPCPTCGRQKCVLGGNAGADCGFASQCPGGTCSHVLKCLGGPQNNADCTIHGSSHFGEMSFDCPPEPSALVGNLPIAIDYTSGTATRSLDANSPNCRAVGYFSDKCFCDTCDNEAANACASNAVCTKQCRGGTNNGTNCTDPSECPGGACAGGICGGKRCGIGANAGVPCTSNSECPPGGGGACGVPGLQTAPNQCDPGTFCVPDPADTDSSNEGVCDIGPVEGFCGPHADFGQCSVDADCAQFNRCVGGTNDGDIGCLTNADCPGGVCEVQTCSIQKNRECFVDNGVIGKHCFYGTNALEPCTTIADCPDQSPGTFCGGGTVTASGLPYPPCGNVGSGKVAAFFCIPPTSAGSVNAVSGLPGLGRVTIPTTYTFN